MKIQLDNVNLNSLSGPNSFGRKLLNELSAMGHSVSTEHAAADVQLSFIQIVNKRSEKIVLRLDGIYFNTRQDWEALNASIKRSYQEACCVVFQSEFNRRLTEKYFGPTENYFVIGNGTSYKEVGCIPPAPHPIFDKFEELWSCSSSWRPHKRLQENIAYFFGHAPENAGLVILGENPDFQVNDPRVLYAGKQSWETCISIYKRSKKFLHLAFLDHCPNVVVDARACGCDIVVASSGGTKEIAGPTATVIEDLDWDLRPLDLYDPPKLDFTKTSMNGIESSVDIKSCAHRYLRCLSSVLEREI